MRRGDERCSGKSWCHVSFSFGVSDWLRLDFSSDPTRQTQVKHQTVNSCWHIRLVLCPGVDTVSVVCLVSRHWLPGWEGEALRLRPAGSGLGRSLGRSRPLQTSAQAGLTTAPLQAAFMCPLMRKPPAQQPAIKHRQIKTPKYESAM